MLDFTYPRYKVERDPNQCIQCGVCARQCANEVHMSIPTWAVWSPITRSA